MLSVFPQLLFLSPLVGTLLRLAVGLTFLSIAYIQWKRREEIGGMRFPLIGMPGSGFIVLLALIQAVIGVALIIGYATQVFALVALVSSVKQFIFAKRYSRAIPLCRVDYFYLAIMCICLLLMGAGAFAFDLPL